MRLLASIFFMNVITAAFAAGYTLTPSDTGLIQPRFCPVGFRPVLFSYDHNIVDGRKLNFNFRDSRNKHQNSGRLIQPVRDRMDKVLTVMGGGMFIGFYTGKIYGLIRYRNNPNIPGWENDANRQESAALHALIGLAAGGVAFGLYELIFGK